ncbi:hypothetical protein R84B8_00619 [Treponema sp. R8-4-B8]
MKIPKKILNEFEKETDSLLYGEVNLCLFLRDGKGRFELSRRRTLPDNMKIIGLKANEETKKGEKNEN